MTDFSAFGRAMRHLASTGAIGKREELAVVGALESLDAAVDAAEADIDTLQATIRPLIHAKNAKVADYEIVLTDVGKVVEITVTTTANTVTIPANSKTPFQIGTVLYVVSLGTGVTTVTAATGVTLNGASAGTLALTRYGMAMLYKTGEDAWIVGQWTPVAFS